MNLFRFFPIRSRETTQTRPCDDLFRPTMPEHQVIGYRDIIDEVYRRRLADIKRFDADYVREDSNVIGRTWPMQVGYTPPHQEAA